MNIVLKGKSFIYLPATVVINMIVYIVRIAILFVRLPEALPQKVMENVWDSVKRPGISG